MLSPSELFNLIIENIRRLFTTPIADWTWGQWLLMIILLSVISSCCGGSACLCCRGRRRYNRRRQQRDRDRDNQDGYYSSYRVNGLSLIHI